MTNIHGTNLWPVRVKTTDRRVPAILIDPFERKHRPLEIVEDENWLKQLIGTDCLDIHDLGGDNVLILDDSGLQRKGRRFFVLPRGAGGQVLGGRCVLVRRSWPAKNLLPVNQKTARIVEGEIFYSDDYQESLKHGRRVTPPRGYFR